MEIHVPLEIVLNWLGEHYDPNYDIYQIEIFAYTLHIQLYNNHASIICVKEFSLNELMKFLDFMKVVGVY